MPTPVQLGAIQGYALTYSPVAARVGAIQGYALVRTPNLPSFTIAGKLTLLAALNKQYKTAFTATQMLFGNPQVLANDQDYNTSISLTADRSSNYFGTKTMRYNRVDLAYALSGKDTSLPTSGMGSTIWTSLAAINTKYNSVLTTADVVDAPIASGATGITITAADTSVVFTPGTTMRIGTQIPTMAQAFPQVEIFAF